jgi:general secretion pathway protein K
MRRFPSSRASVLVIVLVTLMFASFALILFVEQATNDLLVESREMVAKRLRRDGYSALESVLATLEDFRRADSGYHSPAEGWRDPLGFSGWQPRAGVTVDVSIEDESGKISLSVVDAAMFTNLFTYWKVKPADAERLTDALMGWMRRDYVPASARSPDYDQASLPFEAPARPMRSFAELAAIDFVREFFYDESGRPNEYWWRFTRTFSLYNFNQMNLNAATPDVLAALGFPDESQHARLAEYLAGKGQYSTQGPQWMTTSGQASSLLGSPSLPPVMGYEAKALRVNVTVHEGRNEFRLSAVVAPSGGATVVKAASPSTQTSTPTVNVKAPGAAAAPPPKTPAPQLNYPFTLLEIRENGEIPPPPPAAAE